MSCPTLGSRPALDGNSPPGAASNRLSGPGSRPGVAPSIPKKLSIPRRAPRVCPPMAALFFRGFRSPSASPRFRIRARPRAPRFQSRPLEDWVRGMGPGNAATGRGSRSAGGRWGRAGCAGGTRGRGVRGGGAAGPCRGGAGAGASVTGVGRSGPPPPSSSSRRRPPAAVGGGGRPHGVNTYAMQPTGRPSATDVFLLREKKKNKTSFTAF